MESIMLDYTNCLSSAIGSEGISLSELENYEEYMAKCVEEIEKEKFGFMKLPYSDIPKQLDILDERMDFVENIIVLGIGGSALGTAAINDALSDINSKRKLFVCDNSDPAYLTRILEEVKLDKSVFIVVSKSGTTAETMASFLIVRKRLDKIRDGYKRHLIFITDPEKGVLRKLSREEGILTFDIPPDVGGRFSVLSAVGMVPSYLLGFDVDSILAGAREMDKRVRERNLFKNPAALNALIHVLMMKKGKSISVMMPYSNELKYLADWYVQLWAESLGKRFDISGKVVEVGQTPIGALGATDQHSQLQLYNEGPRDKIITMIRVERHQHDLPIPNIYPEEERLSYFNDYTLGDLINYEQLATSISLTNNGRPNLTLIFPHISEEMLGQFFYMYEMQTAIAAKLLNINAFDQPGVEAGKNATYALMGRKGYETLREEIISKLKTRERNLV